MPPERGHGVLIKRTALAAVTETGALASWAWIAASLTVPRATSARSKAGICIWGDNGRRVPLGHYAGKRTDETTSCPGQRQSTFGPAMSWAAAALVSAGSG